MLRKLDEGYNTVWLQVQEGGRTPQLLQRTVLYLDGGVTTTGRGGDNQ